MSTNKQVTLQVVLIYYSDKQHIHRKLLIYLKTWHNTICFIKISTEPCRRKFMSKFKYKLFNLELFEGILCITLSIKQKNIQLSLVYFSEVDRVVCETVRNKWQLCKEDFLQMTTLQRGLPPNRKQIIKTHLLSSLLVARHYMFLVFLIAACKLVLCKEFLKFFAFDIVLNRFYLARHFMSRERTFHLQNTKKYNQLKV